MARCLLLFAGALLITTISLTDHMVSPSGHGFAKCCYDGEGLTIQENRLECVKMQDDALLLQWINYLMQNTQKSKLPKCADPQLMWLDLLPTETVILNGLEISSPKPETTVIDDSCVDAFMNQTNHVYEPTRQLVQVSCRELTVLDQVASNHKELKIDETELSFCASKSTALRYKICCPFGKIMDGDFLSCEQGESRLPFNDTNWEGIPYGYPVCPYDSPFTIYYVDESKLSYEPETGMSIEVKRRGRNDILPVNESNSCLSINASSHLVTAVICMEPSFCSNNICSRFCCPLGASGYDCIQENSTEGRGEDFSRDSHITLADKIGASIRSTFDDEGDDEGWGMLIGKPNCSLHFWKMDETQETVKLQNDYHNSCLVMMVKDTIFGEGIGYLTCFPPDAHDDIPRLDSIVKVILASTSCFFLLATLLVYLCVPSLQNLHGKTLMCHATSLLFAYACLTLNEMVAFGILDKMEPSISADSACECLAYAMLLSFHSAFLWLNVMSFDIWWTFGGLRGSWMSVYATNAGGTKKKTHRTRFASYCGYAWGIALLLTLGPKLADSLDWPLAPNMGFDRCWFSNSSSQVPFFIMPITMTLLMNLLFFIVTAYRCTKIKADLKLAQAKDGDPTLKRFDSRKMRLKLNAKLSLVMGLPWLIENFSAYSEQYSLLDSYLNRLLDFVDLINLLQGLWFFVLFVAKPRVYREFRKRFACCFCKCNNGDDHNNEIHMCERLKKAGD